MDLQQYVEVSSSLRAASGDLAELQLHQAAKWAAEALHGMHVIASKEERAIYNQMTRKRQVERLQQRLADEEMDVADQDKFALAVQYFHCKEFQRCGHALANVESPKSVFVRLYARYLNVEKTAHEQNGSVFGGAGNGAGDGAGDPSPSDDYADILKELEGYRHWKDPFLLYLTGVVLKKEKNVELAQDVLIRSLVAYPFNWSCWAELISSCPKFEDATAVLAKFQRNAKFNASGANKVMLSVYEIVINQEFFQRSPELYQSLDYLLAVFPGFSFLKIQKALISYHALDYATAEEIFDDILVQDPYRLDDMDTYSNILYVMEKKSKLSFLAQFSSSIDKFRPETCCIIANYYSLRFEHEKSIMYYKRAILLNEECLSAWTLMGHEFVELKNSHAAIESYRRAVDINSKDYRAWYGLGQAYEFLDMQLYSLYYYQKACALKPMDKRMWQAMGSCYERLNQYANAVKSYEKALNLDKDTAILHKLGLLYDALKDTRQSQYYMKLCVAEEADVVNDETSKAKLWLAKHEAGLGNWEQAYKFSSDVQHGNVHDLEEARNLAREARLKMRSISTSSAVSI